MGAPCDVPVSATAGYRGASAGRCFIGARATVVAALTALATFTPAFTATFTTFTAFAVARRAVLAGSAPAAAICRCAFGRTRSLCHGCLRRGCLRAHPRDVHASRGSHGHHGVARRLRGLRCGLHHPCASLRRPFGIAALVAARPHHHGCRCGVVRRPGPAAAFAATFPAAFAPPAITALAVTATAAATAFTTFAVARAAAFALVFLFGAGRQPGLLRVRLPVRWRQTGP
jgi:hypothetical protein